MTQIETSTQKEPFLSPDYTWVECPLTGGINISWTVSAQAREWERAFGTCQQNITFRQLAAE